MNKTININLGGMFFHIDENAYQKLNRYLNAIRKSLSDDPQGRDEIINDIEMRISELLSDKIVDQRQVVSEADIDMIVEIMGQPEDYIIDEDLFNDSEKESNKSSNKSGKPIKKFYRDMDDKFLGGVASGSAHYIGIEPIWSRIIWLILAFGFGFGFFVYPLLWILLPKAETTAEKLEMEGERVNIDNIERKIREISDSIKDTAAETSDKIKSKYATKAKSGLQELLDTIGLIIIAVLKVFAKFIGLIIILFSSVMLITILISTFSAGSVSFLGIESDFVQVPNEIFNSYLPYWLILFFFFVALAIPFIVLFMLGLKILSSNTKSLSKVTKLTLLALWILSILGLIFSGLDISSKFKYKGLSSETHDVYIKPKDTLTITMNGNEDYNVSKYLKHSNHNEKTIVVDGIKKLYSTDVNFDIRKSTTDKAYIKIRKSARGKNYKNANENAEKLEYQFELDDKNLKLNGYFLNPISTTFYNIEIDVVLYLPKGVKIYLDSSTKTFLDDVANKQDIYDRNMISHYFIMNETQLDCLDCENEVIEINNDNAKLKIDKKGVKLSIETDKGNTEVNIDQNGIVVK